MAQYHKAPIIIALLGLTLLAIQVPKPWDLLGGFMLLAGICACLGEYLGKLLRS